MLSNIPTSPKRLTYFVASLLIVSVIVFSHPSSPISQQSRLSGFLSSNRLPRIDFVGASNSTLGFETIIAVSPNKSLGGETIWRQDGMVRAANLTGLTIQIPPQPNWTTIVNSTDWLTTVLKEKIISDTGDGSLHDGRLLSRLGHLAILQQILSSSIRSALIIENDADWGVEIRAQTPAVAHAVQEITKSNDDINPWGEKWDILSLGHCGAGILDRADSKYVVINDSTSIPPSNYSRLRDPGRKTPDHGRLIYPTSGQVCTYAYAVTFTGAAKIFSLLADVNGPWDLELAALCGQEKIACYAVAPELFHHQRWTGHAVLSGDELHGGLHLGEKSQKFTHNILHSARCNSEPEVDLRSGLVECLPTGYTREAYGT